MTENETTGDGAQDDETLEFDSGVTEFDAEVEPGAVTEADALGEAEANETKPLYNIGDVLSIFGGYTAQVTQVFLGFETACADYAPRPGHPPSFETILRKGRGYDAAGWFYSCEIANASRKPIGVAEGDAELKLIRE